MLKCPKNVDMAMGRVIFCFEAASFSFLGCQPWGGSNLFCRTTKNMKLFMNNPLWVSEVIILKFCKDLGI